MPSRTAGPTHRRIARAAGLLALGGGSLTLVAELVRGSEQLLQVAAVLAMLLAIVLLARLGVAGRGHLARVSLALWALSFVLELVAVRTGSATLLGTGTGTTASWLTRAAWTLTFLVGPVVAGVAIARAGVLTGWRRWVPLAFGVSQGLEVLVLVLGVEALLAGIVGTAAPLLNLVFTLALVTAFRRSEWLERWRRSGQILRVG